MEKQIFTDVASALADAGEQHGNRVFGGQWLDNHWMNTPGPIYCGQTDNCGTGPIEAPENVHVDAKGFEVIYRQPTNVIQLEQVINAACCDPFGAYGADGNLHWSYEKIKEWWSRRQELLAEISKLHNQWSGENMDAFYYEQWRNYILNDVHEYLQLYAFFLDSCQMPSENDLLPDV